MIKEISRVLPYFLNSCKICRNRHKLDRKLNKDVTFLFHLINIGYVVIFSYLLRLNYYCKH